MHWIDWSDWFIKFHNCSQTTGRSFSRRVNIFLFKWMRNGMKWTYRYWNLKFSRKRNCSGWGTWKEAQRTVRNLLRSVIPIFRMSCVLRPPRGIDLCNACAMSTPFLRELLPGIRMIVTALSRPSLGARSVNSRNTGRGIKRVAWKHGQSVRYIQHAYKPGASALRQHRKVSECGISSGRATAVSGSTAGN